MIDELKMTTKEEAFAATIGIKHAHSFNLGWDACEAAIARQSEYQNGPWACFHCGEVFNDEASAALHFGTSTMQNPACSFDVAALRETEALIRRYAEEDTDLHRELYRLQADHAVALRREEEKGYARGLRDAHLLDPAESSALKKSFDDCITTGTGVVQIMHVPIDQVTNGPVPIDCSGDPSCCPDNEGFGCHCLNVGIVQRNPEREP